MLLNLFDTSLANTLKPTSTPAMIAYSTAVTARQAESGGLLLRTRFDDRGAFAVGYHTVAPKMHDMVFAAQPRFELVAVVRTVRHAGIADVLHGKEGFRRSEVNDDAIFGARAGGVRR
jgi:hypothetical protein